MKFKKLRNKIEEKRNSDNFFWKALIRLKDFIWNCRMDGIYIFRTLLGESLPTAAKIEIVRDCNLQCAFCPIGKNTAKKFPMMSFYRYKKIIGDISSFVNTLTLFNIGEPLLHPELGKFIKYAKDSGIDKIKIASNGLLLTEEKSIELIESGLYEIRISIDATDSETYNKFRVGGDFSRLLKNIQRFGEIRNKMSSKFPKLCLQFIITSYNEDKKDDFKKLATKLGADFIKYKTLNVNLPGDSDAKERVDFLPKDLKYSRYKDKKTLQLKTKIDPRYCHLPWYKITVNADGTVVPCCYDFNNKYPLGHVDSGNFKTWWNTKERKQFYRLLTKDPYKIEICQNCAYEGCK